MDEPMFIAPKVRRTCEPIQFVKTTNDLARALGFVPIYKTHRASLADRDKKRKAALSGELLKCDGPSQDRDSRDCQKA